MGLLTPGRIYPGSTVRITGEFFDSDDVDTDPSTSITFKLRSPTGVETSYVYGTDAEVQKQSTGNYTADIYLDEGGRWLYRWQAATGDDISVAGEGAILVQASKFDGFTGGWGRGYQ